MKLTHRWFIYLFIVTFVGCDVQNIEIDEDQEKVASNSLNVQPEFLLKQLDNYGLSSAVDINDDGDMIGGNFYWSHSKKELLDMGIASRAMNNNGQVISYNRYWDNKNGVVELDTLKLDNISGSYTRAYDINDKGDVVGEVNYFYGKKEYSDLEFWSVVWNKEAGIKEYFGYFSIAHAVNNNGQIAGVSDIEAPPHEIYVTRNNDFGIKSDEQYGWGIPYSINNHAQIVGSIQIKESNSGNSLVSQNKHSLSESRKDIIDLLKLTNSYGVYEYKHVVEMIKNSTLDSEIQKMGDHNFSFTEHDLVNEDLLNQLGKDNQQKVVAKALNTVNNKSSVAFIWDQESGIKNLGTLGGAWSAAFDVNDHGQVVGYSDIGNGEYRAFYWDKENGMIELPSNGNNSIARAINNHGQIVGENEGPVLWEIGK